MDRQIDRLIRWTCGREGRWLNDNTMNGWMEMIGICRVVYTNINETDGNELLVDKDSVENGRVYIRRWCRPIMVVTPHTSSPAA
eukprot:scaffold47644_cov15-Prasinocladus_malaysianus.AAC.1